MSSKRKSGHQTSGAGSPDPKRRKIPPHVLDKLFGGHDAPKNFILNVNSMAQNEQVIEKETPEGVTEAGIALIKQLREARDKRGRVISTQFLTLPSKEQIPEYYEATPLPLAFDIIETKLRNYDYPTLTTLESDLKRMISNAKHFNERTSEIHSDAEKIRKLVSHYMTKTNPAYQDPDYIPFPTPIPEDRDRIPHNVGYSQNEFNGEANIEDGKERARPKMILHGPSAAKDQSRHRASSTPAILGAADAGESFEGNTFQQAQDKIVTEMMDLTNEEGSLISTPFHNLPSRDLRDYYQVIKNPVSLKAIQKQVRGIKGREKPTGVSFFKSWQMFEDEMNLLWENARLYNEDGSDISALAGELEKYFKNRIVEAKEAVQEPAQPRVKLRMPVKDPEPIARLKLHVTPKQSHDQVNGFTVDSESLQRQKDMVKAGINGHVEPGVSVDGVLTMQKTPATLNGTQDLSGQPNSFVASPPTPVNGASRSDRQQLISPATTPNAALHPSSRSREDSSSSQGPGAIAMPPPSSTTPQLASASPHPQPMSIPAAPPPAPPVNPLECKWRQPGKGMADALIKNVVIRTHHGLSLPSHFRLSLPPSPTMTQHSVTISLPSTHYCLLVSPAFVPQEPGRQVRTFLMLNHRQQTPSSTAKIEDIDPRRPVYELRPDSDDLNRIDIECIAGLPRGAPKVGTGPDFEFEKFTIFVSYWSTMALESSS